MSGRPRLLLLSCSGPERAAALPALGADVKSLKKFFKEQQNAELSGASSPSASSYLTTAGLEGKLKTATRRGRIFDSDPQRHPLLIFAFLGHGEPGSGAWKLSDGSLFEFDHFLNIWEAKPRDSELLVYSDSCYSGHLCRRAALREARVFVQASCAEDEEVRDGGFTPHWIGFSSSTTSRSAALREVAPEVRHLDHALFRRRNAHPVAYRPRHASAETTLRGLRLLMANEEDVERYWGVLRESADGAPGGQASSGPHDGQEDWEHDGRALLCLAGNRRRLTRLQTDAARVIQQAWRGFLHTQESVLSAGQATKMKMDALATAACTPEATDTWVVMTGSSLSLLDLLHFGLASREHQGALSKNVVERAEQDLAVVLGSVNYWGEQRKEVTQAARVSIARGCPDRTVMLQALRGRNAAKALQFASEELRADREVVRHVVGRRGSALRFAHERLRADLEVAQAALRQDVSALGFVAKELWADHDFENFAAMTIMRNRGQGLEFAPRALVLEQVNRLGQSLRHARQEHRADPEIVLLAVSKDGSAFQHASPELQADRNIALRAMANDGSALQHASQELRADREVVLRAAAQNGSALQHASQELRADREFVLGAVAQNAPALQHASQELRADREFVLRAVAQNREALRYASQELRADREFVLRAPAQDADALRRASQELRADREVVLRAVAQNGVALEYASPELQADREVVLRAVAQAGWALRHASQELRADREVVLRAVAQRGWALSFASQELQADREVVLRAVAQDGEALVFASQELRADREVVLRAVAQDGEALVFASRELWADPEFMPQAQRLRLPSALGRGASDAEEEEARDSDADRWAHYDCHLL